MAELLLDAFEMLFPRLCPPFRLVGDWIVAFVVLALRLLVVAITSGSVGVMLPGLAIFSSFTDVQGVDEVSLLLMWDSILACVDPLRPLGVL